MNTTTSTIKKILRYSNYKVEIKGKTWPFHQKISGYGYKWDKYNESWVINLSSPHTDYRVQRLRRFFKKLGILGKQITITAKIF